MAGMYGLELLAPAMAHADEDLRDVMQNDVVELRVERNLFLKILRDVPTQHQHLDPDHLHDPDVMLVYGLRLRMVEAPAPANHYPREFGIYTRGRPWRWRVA